MYSYLVGIFICFTLILLWRVKRKSLLHFEFKFKLAELQNELRWACINDKIDGDSWAYSYLDKTISASINNLRYFNIYSAIGLSLIHSKDKKYVRFSRGLHDRLNDPVNKKAKEIYDKMGDLILYYVLKKHIFFKFLALGYIVLDRGKKRNASNNNNKPPTSTERKIIGLRDYPETSASKEYMFV